MLDEPKAIMELAPATHLFPWLLGKQEFPVCVCERERKWFEVSLAREWKITLPSQETYQEAEEGSAFHIAMFQTR